MYSIICSLVLLEHENKSSFRIFLLGKLDFHYLHYYLTTWNSYSRKSPPWTTCPSVLKTRTSMFPSFICRRHFWYSIFYNYIGSFSRNLLCSPQCRSPMTAGKKPTSYLICRVIQPYHPLTLSMKRRLLCTKWILGNIFATNTDVAYCDDLSNGTNSDL